MVTAVALLGYWVYTPIQQTSSAGLDTVTVSLVDSEAVNTDSQVSVAFPVGNLSNGETISIYLGETTAGDEWDDDSITTSHISCDDDGTGETYTVGSVAAATASVPMKVVWTATTVGAAATTVTCLIGDGGANNPNNPNAADGFSIGVVTTDDAGAGIAYVGNANDVTVSADVLPNLALTIDNADASVCTTTSGVTSCDLGTVTTAAVNTGNYDVNVGTNATGGATVQIDEDQDLTSGSDTITDIVEDTGGTVTAGVEEYGIGVAADAGTWTESGDFTDDDTPIPSSATTVATSAGPADISSDDITVTHKVSVSSSTEAGNYSHTTTWTATADF